MNLNEADKPEDMIALRMWASSNRLLSLRAYPIKAVQDLRQQIETGRPVTSTGRLVADVAEGLVARIEPVVADFDDRVDGYEESLLEADAKLPRTALAEFRRAVLSLRRHIVPQREALAQLLREGSDLLGQNEQLRLPGDVRQSHAPCLGSRYHS